MLLHEYETTLIIRPDMDDPSTYGIVERIEGVINDNGGTLLLRDDWGKRKLAYAIEKHLKGHYVLLDFLGPAEMVAELERRIRITDGVIRFLTVRTADAVDVETRVAEAAELRARREEEAARRRAEAEAEEGDEESDEDEDNEPAHAG